MDNHTPIPIVKAKRAKLKGKWTERGMVDFNVNNQVALQVRLECYECGYYVNAFISENTIQIKPCKCDGISPSPEGEEDA